MLSSSENKVFRKLERCLNLILDPSSSEDAVLNVRSKLGLVLHFCCLKDPVSTLSGIIEMMGNIQATSGVSIILLSCVCFILKYYPDFHSQENTDLANWIQAPILRHAVSSDPNNMFNLNRFLQAGGAKLLAFPDVVLCELLLRFESIGVDIAAKPIGYLIDINPDSHSSLFWRSFPNLNSNSDSLSEQSKSFLILLSKIIPIAEISPPKDQAQLISLRNICENNCILINSAENAGQQLNFRQTEISLTILRWLVSKQCYCPEKLSDQYTSGGLRSLVMDCWSEYAKYGDLLKLPKFTCEEDQMKTIYIKLIRNAIINPEFSFNKISIPYWLWDQIMIEFSPTQNNDMLPENQSNHIETDQTNRIHSFYDLGNNELMYCPDIASVLPEWIFIHCLRFKCSNPESSSRLIKIISELPSSILISHYDDFINFIINHLTSFPHNATLLADCIRNLICLILPRVNPLIERIADSIDYFDEQNLTSRLNLLTTIFSFKVEVNYYLDIFDNLLESLPIISNTISLSFCDAMFNFLIVISKHIPQYSTFLFEISMAVLCATSASAAHSLSTGQLQQQQLPQSSLGHNMSAPILAPPNSPTANRVRIVANNDSVTIKNINTNSTATFNINPNNELFIEDEPSFINRSEYGHVIYLASMRFYSVVSSDIVLNPNYKPSSSFPLTTLALKLIKTLHCDFFTNEIEGINTLLDVLPTFLSLFPIESLDLINFLLNNTSLNFRKRLGSFILPLKKVLSYSTSFELILDALDFKGTVETKYKCETFNLKPISYEKLPDDINMSRLTLQSHPILTPLALDKADQLSLLLENWAPPVDESHLYYLAMNFKKTFSFHTERQLRLFLSHFKFDQPEQRSYDSWLSRDFSTKPQEKIRLEKKFTNEFEEFGFLYPIDTKLPTIPLIVSMVKNYRSHPELTKTLCSILSKNIPDCLDVCKDKFWFMKFLLVNGIAFNFPKDIENQKCIALGVRTGLIDRSIIIHNGELLKYGNESTASSKDDNELESIEHNLTTDVRQLDESEIEEWLKIDRLYSLLPNEMELIWPNLFRDFSYSLSSLFLPKRGLISNELLLKLMKHASSLPSTLSFQSSALNDAQLPSLTTTQSIPQSSHLSMIPCCAVQHILEYLDAFISDTNRTDAHKLFVSKESSILNFINRVDLQNPVVFHSLFYLVNTLTLMYRKEKQNGFVLKIDDAFLKNVFSSTTYAACVYEVLPMLKKIRDLYETSGQKLKLSESEINFLDCLRTGFSAVQEFIPPELLID